MSACLPTIAKHILDLQPSNDPSCKKLSKQQDICTYCCPNFTVSWVLLGAVKKCLHDHMFQALQENLPKALASVELTMQSVSIGWSDACMHTKQAWLLSAKDAQKKACMICLSHYVILPNIVIGQSHMSKKKNSISFEYYQNYSGRINQTIKRNTFTR